MGLKKLFKIKPPESETVEQNRAKLSELGVPTKGAKAPRKEKFAAYGKFAADRSTKATHVPPGYEKYDENSFNGNDEVGGGNALTKPPVDPYSAQASYSLGEKLDPYRAVDQDPYSNIGCPTPYSNMAPQKSNHGNPYRPSTVTSYKGGNSPGTPNVNNPYAGMTNDTYSAGAISRASALSCSSPRPKPPYAQTSGSTLAQDRSAEAEEDDELDLNAAPVQVGDNGDDEYNLNNSLHEEDGAIDGGSKGFQTFEDIQREQQLKEQQEEDEDVDEIKQQIRFTKQSSVAATRNTLKMAQDAELAGRNALGVLGHQTEKLGNVEQNLHLMKVQNRLAEDQVGELKKLNRNILAVHVSNPFTSKRRMREAEERVKALRLSDRPQQEAINNNLAQSAQRIEGVLSSSESGVRERYQRDAVLRRARQYQFENDEEDDEMELEIDRNLNQISQVNGRLRKLAISAGKEIDSQKNCIQRIEENADDLDLRIHVNTNKLTNIR